MKNYSGSDSPETPGNNDLVYRPQAEGLGIAGSTRAKREGEIGTLMSIMDQETSMILDRLEVLHSKMSPILRNEPSNPENSDKEASATTDLGGEMKRILSRLYDIKRKVIFLSEHNEL